MLSHSAFAPLAQSVTAMLKEEFFHMFTGNTGLTRIIRAGKIPIPIIQKYFNKWLSTAYDLFGTDRSSSAQWAYVWGLKGRYDEDQKKEEADKEKLNETARDIYIGECQQLVDKLNEFIPEGQTKLTIPDLKFHRSIGNYTGKLYGADGRLLSGEEHRKHLSEVLPTEQDERILSEIFKQKDWVLQMN
jgi:benzoyl-CoA 2,3-dioxygenase component B